MNSSTPRALLLSMVLMLCACTTTTPPAQAPATPSWTPLTESVTPIANTEWWAKWWVPRHEEKLAEIRQLRAEKKNIEVVFLGDSITQGWEKEGVNVWNREYRKYNALNLGFSGDRTEHVLWRLQNGEVDGIHPKVVVVMFGTNNTGHRHEAAQSTAAAIKRDLDELRQHLPDTRILLLAIFPREANPDHEFRRINEEINRILSGYADNKKTFFLNINKALLNADGTLSKDIMPDLLHPNEKGYEIWAREMAPELQKLLQ